ncbi:hypothetical protein AAA294_02195 [Fusobacterium varium]|uniref:hypothetical protein n=1 Tax=Fusobacterium varium TaxID=856 RepID=UPI0032BF6E80
MEKLFDIGLTNYYKKFKEDKEYLEEFKSSILEKYNSDDIEGLIFNFKKINMEDIFLKNIFEAAFEITKLKLKFFVKNCDESNLNYIKLLLNKYKIDSAN